MLNHYSDHYSDHHRDDNCGTLIIDLTDGLRPTVGHRDSLIKLDSPMNINTELRSLVIDAEDSYLQETELQRMKRQLSGLRQRLEVYEVLRDFELEVFQAVADDLQSAYAGLDNQQTNRLLEDGLAILRYGAMAMLQDNPDFFQRQVLDCLPDRANAYGIEAALLEMLRLMLLHLNKRIPGTQVEVFQPYLEQVQRTIVNAQSARQALVAA
jgi:hypothetical protein